MKSGAPLVTSPRSERAMEPKCASTATFYSNDVTDGDPGGIVEGEADIHDFRTPPLWGISKTQPYMHDGRASTIEAAIASHAGEAAPSRDAVGGLDAQQRELLLMYLGSL